MSTKIQDIANEIVLGVGLAPQTITTTTNGPTGDLINADGPCFAIQQVGAVSGTSPTLAGKIQESVDGTAWTDVAGVTFTTVTASTNNQCIAFDRTKRFLRYVGTVGGTSPSFAVAVVISQQKKQI
jgi:hypothetical protein